MGNAVRKNSTIVRADDLVLRLTRAGIRILSPRAPELAARYAERLFLTARRHRRPAWEEEVLTTAKRFGIPHEGSLLPAWKWGRGSSTVLLVHGWEGRGSQLGAFVPPLVARGLRVVAFDAPGHGEAKSRVASLVEHARAVASASKFLGPLHAIVGHSVGGSASILATRFGARASRFALVAPPVSPAGFAAGFARALDLSANVRDGMITRLERRYGIALSELDIRSYAARLGAPLLVVHDVGDRMVPHEDGSAIARAGGGRLVSTEGLGHRRILRAPEVVDAVVPFVADGVRHDAFAETLDGELFFRDSRW